MRPKAKIHNVTLNKKKYNSRRFETENQIQDFLLEIYHNAINDESLITEVDCYYKVADQHELVYDYATFRALVHDYQIEDITYIYNKIKDLCFSRKHKLYVSGEMRGKGIFEKECNTKYTTHIDDGVVVNKNEDTTNVNISLLWKDENGNPVIWKP